jgi:hypothetical protein
MTSLLAAAAWLLLSWTLGNLWATRANLRRASDLDEYAEVLLRDRQRVLSAAKDIREREASLEVFVALNPITRLKQRTEA